MARKRAGTPECPSPSPHRLGRAYHSAGVSAGRNCTSRPPRSRKNLSRLRQFPIRHGRLSSRLHGLARRRRNRPLPPGEGTIRPARHPGRDAACRRQSEPGWEDPGSQPGDTPSQTAEYGSLPQIRHWPARKTILQTNEQGGPRRDRSAHGKVLEISSPFVVTIGGAAATPPERSLLLQNRRRDLDDGNELFLSRRIRSDIQSVSCEPLSRAAHWATPPVSTGPPATRFLKPAWLHNHLRASCPTLPTASVKALAAD